MRLDKFLKVTRLAKRRSEAKEALDAGRIECGGRMLKASHEVRAGEELLIHYATRDVLVRVEAVPETSGPRVKPESMYTILSPAARNSNVVGPATPVPGTRAAGATTSIGGRGRRS